MKTKFKIGYLPLSKVNWTNDTLEAARANDPSASKCPKRKRLPSMKY